MNFPFSKIKFCYTSFIVLVFPLFSLGQNYTSYLTGNPNDVVVNPAGGVCLMGGATEDDNAMKWFLKRAKGGDVLVLRTTGSNGYNSYLYSSLGIPVNSVETIVCNNAAASSDPYIIQKILKAEAIWFAGGNQWTYINYWRNSPVDSAINLSIRQRNIAIGGTSAGMAIQGKFYYSAQNGSVTSAAALSNPFNSLMTVDSASFLKNSFLSDVITDTHFDNPDRKGRLVSFLARIKTSYGLFGKAIACDEYTAVCIDTNGIASVFGGYPVHDDNAYFIQSNCELAVKAPENCASGTPLTWNLSGLAIKAYQIKGDSTGNKKFNLNNLQSGTGGSWYNWAVTNGVFSEQLGNALNCLPLSVPSASTSSTIRVFPNPVKNSLYFSLDKGNSGLAGVNVVNLLGQQFPLKADFLGDGYSVDFTGIPSGVYSVILLGPDGAFSHAKVVKE